jgi:hypothetical protein
MVIFGAVMETIGFWVGSHTHCQFVFQLTQFLPLKEAVWYAVVLYPAWLVASQQRLSLFREMMLMALLGILTDLPYELVNSRPGIRLVFIDPSCTLIDLSDKMLHASAAVCYSFMLVAAMLSAVIRTVSDGRSQLATRVSPDSIMLAIPFSVPLVLVAFLPVHLLKLLGCSQQWGQLLLAHRPSAITTPLAWLDVVVQEHLSCRRTSAVTETHVFILLVLIAISAALPPLLFTPLVGGGGSSPLDNSTTHGRKRLSGSTTSGSTTSGSTASGSTTRRRNLHPRRSKSPCPSVFPRASVAVTTAAAPAAAPAAALAAAPGSRAVQTAPSLVGVALAMPAMCHCLFLFLMLVHEDCSNPEQLHKLLLSGNTECGDVIETCMALVVLAGIHAALLWWCSKRLAGGAHVEAAWQSTNPSDT